MKKRIATVGLMMGGLLVINLIAQNEAWSKLQGDAKLRELVIVKSNSASNSFKIGLDSLRNRLNRVGIKENIKIEILISDSLIIEHGRNSIVVQGGRNEVVGASSGIVVQGGLHGVSILGSFQPSSSRQGSTWSSIPDSIEIRLNGILDQSKATLPARLVLKNSSGQIKCDWNINLKWSSSL